MLTPSLAAYLLTEKFCYHQPFYRLEWRLRATHGIQLRRDIMCTWHNHLAEMMQPLYGRLAEHMRAGHYLKVDESYPYLFVDGMWLKQSWGGEVKNVSILVAIAVNERGQREVVGVVEGKKKMVRAGEGCCAT